MPLPLIAGEDIIAIARHSPLFCCAGCLSRHRRHLSPIITASILGLSINRAAKPKLTHATINYRTRMADGGLFQRLADVELLASMVDWRLVEQGGYVAANPFHTQKLLERICAKFEPMIDEERRQRRAEIETAAAGAGSGLAFRRLTIGELRNLSPAARRLLGRNAKAGGRGGADALAAIGEDRFTESVDFIAAKERDQWLKLARRLDDHSMRLAAWLYDNRRRGQTPMNVPIDWMRPGEPWRVCGLPAAITGDELDLDGHSFPLAMLNGRVPGDWRSVKIRGAAPSMREEPPF